MDYYKSLRNKYTSHWDPWKQRDPVYQVCFPHLPSAESHLMLSERDPIQEDVQDCVEN